MSLLRELLNEAPKPVKTATRKPEIDDIFGDDFQSPSVARDKSVAGKQRQGSSLRDAIGKTDMSRAPRVNTRAMADLPADDVDSVGAGDADPEEPTNALAKTTKDVRAAGKAKADWMGVDQLPGYMQTGIRRMGRVVFSPLTRTKLENISILANLGGHGPNKQMELNAVAHYAMKNATETRDLSMQFGEMIPGYEPEAKLYVTPHDTYLVVRDEMGQYIYSWESKDTKDAFVRSIEDGGSPKSLE